MTKIINSKRSGSYLLKILILIIFQFSILTHKGKSLVIGKNNFLATNTKIENYEDFIVTSINLKHQVSREIRKVVHFQFLSWPDFGVPDSALSILSLLQKVREKEFELLKSQIGKTVKNRNSN